MLESYFFIPGDKPKFINKINELKADYYVIDLEDSVSISNKAVALDNLMHLKIDNNTFVRIPFKEKDYSNTQILEVIKKFNGRIVFPKVRTSKELNEFFTSHNFGFPFKIILLVENPTCFINISEILNEYGNQIHAIGFGSHDFCAAMGMKHDFEHLKHYKKQLILISKAYGIRYIDGVDTNIRDLTDFIKECTYAFDAGADGKFIIHPDQLENLFSLEYFSNDELAEMQGVYSKMKALGKKDIDILEINGKIYEKPHLAKIEKIFSKLGKKVSD